MPCGFAREVSYWLLAAVLLLTSVSAHAVEEPKSPDSAAANKSSGTPTAEATNTATAATPGDHAAKPNLHKLSLPHLKATAILLAVDGVKTNIAPPGSSLSGRGLFATAMAAGHQFRREPLIGMFRLHASQVAWGDFGNVTVNTLAQGGLRP